MLCVDLVRPFLVSENLIWAPSAGQSHAHAKQQPRARKARQGSSLLVGSEGRGRGDGVAVWVVGIARLLLV